MTYVGGSDLSQYSGNGENTEFPTGFRFLKDGDVKVLHTSTSGADNPLVQGVDYTLTGADEDQGTVTFPKLGSAFGTLATGERLTIYLDPEMTQERAFSNASVLPLAEIEQGLDRLTMICRSLAARLKRAVMYPMSASEEEVGTPQDYIAEVNGERVAAEAAATAANTAKLAAQAAQAGAEEALAQVPDNAGARLNALEDSQAAQDSTLATLSAQVAAASVAGKLVTHTLCGGA